MTFAHAGAVSGGPGKWTAEVPEGWDIRGITNGAFLMTIATRAMGAEAAGRQLISANGTFINPGTPGPAQVDVAVLKSGRSLTTLTGDISQAGRGIVHVTGVFADADRHRPERDLILGDPPTLPDPDECIVAVPAEDPTGFPPPLVGKIEARVHPEDANALMEGPGERPMMRGWFRLRDDEPMDAHSVVLAADSFPPSVFNSPYPAGWTPTVGLSVQVREPNPTGWLACRFTTRFVTDGMLEEDGDIWDEQGHLVALSRQLALVSR